MRNPDPYLNLKRIKKPKKDFLLALKLISKKNISLIDCGCANGEFLYFLKKNNFNGSLNGIDLNKKYIKVAKKIKSLKSANFYNSSIEKFSKQKKKFDTVICLGVSHLYKKFDTLLKNLLAISKKSGTIIIDGFFNEYDMDLLIFYKDYSIKKFNKKIEFKNDFNHFSTTRIVKQLKKLKIKKYKFIKCDYNKINIKKDFNKKPHHFVWTEKYKNKTVITNGTNLILKRSFLLIRK
jgi:2-polyprenyl-3-methyl-5-hydroxy-6-metoxy-1,4-benzoquinol methylase